MKIPRALQSEWAGRLRASGFEDLEGPGGLLSNRGTVSHGFGNPHHMTPESRQEAEEHREAQTEALHRFRFATSRDREIWRCYIDGELLATPARPCEARKRLGLSFRQARKAVARIRTAIDRDAKEGISSMSPSRAPVREKVDRLARQLDVDMLLALVGALS